MTARVTVERLAVAVWSTVHRFRLNIRWHAVGKLVDGMRELGHQDEADWIEQRLAQDDGLTRSAFIRALFEYWRENRVIEYMDRAHEDLVERGKADRARERAARPKKRKRPLR